jgi:hypothetical protein
MSNIAAMLKVSEGHPFRRGAEVKDSTFEILYVRMSPTSDVAASRGRTVGSG